MNRSCVSVEILGDRDCYYTVWTPSWRELLRAVMGHPIVAMSYHNGQPASVRVGLSAIPGEKDRRLELFGLAPCCLTANIKASYRLFMTKWNRWLVARELGRIS